MSRSIFLQTRWKCLSCEFDNIPQHSPVCSMYMMPGYIWDRDVCQLSGCDKRHSLFVMMMMVVMAPAVMTVTMMVEMGEGGDGKNIGCSAKLIALQSAFLIPGLLLLAPDEPSLADRYLIIIFRPLFIVVIIAIVIVIHT